MKVHKIDNHPDLIKHYFIIGDLHEREMNIPAYSIFKQHAKEFDKPRLIINGDFLDAWYLMPKHPMYQRWINRKDGMEQFFIPSYLAEIR